MWPIQRDHECQRIANYNTIVFVDAQQEKPHAINTMSLEMNECCLSMKGFDIG